MAQDKLFLEKRKTGSVLLALASSAAILILSLFIMPYAYAADYTYNINMSLLPISLEQEVVLFNTPNNTLFTQYGSYLDGPNNLFFNNIDSTKVNITIDVPALSQGSYTTSFNTSSGQLITFEIKVIDSPTIEDFDLTTDKNEYIVNDSVYITIYAPVNTSLKLDIYTINSTKSYNATISVSSMLIYIPNQSGNYTIKAAMNNSGYYTVLEKNFVVMERFGCIIIAPDSVIMNKTIGFSTSISGGSYPYTFYWDFGDGLHSSIASPGHSFNDLQTYDLSLIVRDRFNNFASCNHRLNAESEKYTVNIIVLDNSTSKPLGDALIEINNIEKKSNINGKAVFTGIEKGRLAVTISREGYEKYRERFDINSSTEITARMSLKQIDNTKLPVVFVLSPKDGAVIDNSIDNSILNVVFTTSSADMIYNCRLLVNQIPFLGYQILDTIENITANGEKELNAKITNGDFNFKISCENKYGTTITEKINVKGINFPSSVVYSGAQNSALSPADSVQENNLLVAASGTPSAAENEAEKKQELTLEATRQFDRAIERLNGIQKNFAEYSGEEKRLIELMGFIDDVENAKKEVVTLRKEAVNLEGLNIGKSEYNSQRQSILKKLHDIEDNTAFGLSIVKDETISAEPDEDIVKTAILDFMGHRGKNVSAGVLKSLVKKSFELRSGIQIEGKAYITNIVYMSGKTEERSVITKKIIRKPGSEGNSLIIEQIPKSVAENINDINFLFLYELVKEDPVIRIPFENNENSKEICYYVNKLVLFDGLNNPTTVVIPDLSTPGNKITGFSILGVPVDFTGSMQLALIIIVLTVVSAGYVSVYKSKKSKNHVKKEHIAPNMTEKVLRPLPLPKSSAITSQSRAQSSEPERTADFVESVQKISEKNFFAFSSRSAKRESSLSLLITNLLDNIKIGRKEEAFKAYHQIIQLYELQNQNVKADLMPIISYIKNERDVYQLLVLLENANNMIVNGVYIVGSDMHREIDDIYSDLPAETMPRISDQYNHFTNILNMKNFRRDMQMRMTVYNNNNASNGLNDSIFTKK